MRGTCAPRGWSEAQTTSRLWSGMWVVGWQRAILTIIEIIKAKQDSRIPFPCLSSLVVPISFSLRYDRTTGHSGFGGDTDEIGHTTNVVLVDHRRHTSMHSGAVQGGEHGLAAAKSLLTAERTDAPVKPFPVMASLGILVIRTQGSNKKVRTQD